MGSSDFGMALIHFELSVTTDLAGSGVPIAILFLTGKFVWRELNLRLLDHGV